MALSAPQRSTLESELARLHESSFGWARSCCDGDADAASDVLQASYVKVLSGAATFGERSSFRTWFFGVIRFTSLEMMRRSEKALTLHEVSDLYVETALADERLTAEEDVASLRRALALLPDRQREILHLVFYEEATVSEAAEIMDVSIGTARVHYDRAKKRLRSILTAEFDTDARPDIRVVKDSIAPARNIPPLPGTRRKHNE
jgi:RNA polymerase sigma-70 factor (ECF subfamily)